MFKWIKKIKEADFQTLFFYFNWGFYGFLIIASTVYVYVRLPFVRSTPPLEEKILETTIQK